MTAKEVLALAKEYEEEIKHPIITKHYYKYRGEQRCKTHEHWTPRAQELFHIIDEQKVFRCCECGQMVSYFELERYYCDWEDLEHGLYCGYCECAE